MFHWLFLDESDFSSAEHALWKISVLRIILVSGFFLEAVIAIDCSIDAIAIGAYHIVVIVAIFYTLLSAALFYSARRPDCGARILIATVYAAGASILFFIRDSEVAKLGIIFVYTTPIIARLFFSGRLALALMLINVLPFLYLLRNGPFAYFPTLNLTLEASHTYIQSLLFLFFNVCIPLAVFRVLHALDASALRYRQSDSALITSHAQYREFFENAGGPILLCEPNGKILQANTMANELLDRSDCSAPAESLFDLIKPVTEAPPSLPETMATIENAKGREFSSPDGRRLLLEQVTRTAQNHCIVVMRDASNLNVIEKALQRSQESVSFLSKHDALTKLPNRKSLRGHLAETLPRLEGERVMAMVSIRLNSIRLANEKFGSLIGDAFIEHFSEELRRILPANAFCARLRSIVFSIVLPPTRSPDDVIQQVEDLRKRLPQELFVETHHLIVQISTGIALARPGDTSPEELMRRSEVALDSARRSSEYSMALFDEADAAQIRRRIEIELGIVAALKHGEFRLVYQPKVNNRRDISGLEALIRWHSPTLGNVSPAEFIPIAESSGLIHGITRFVIEETCKFIRRTIDSGRRCPPIALNLSAMDVIRHDLLELVDESRTRHATPTALLEFEITETGLIGNEALAITHLNELKNRGSSIAIDDFGTGYSSFSKLSNFPVSSIKIDQSFVARIGQCAKSESIIKAIVSLSEILSCTSIAEGVENEAQEKFLKSVGCQQFQGYYYYRPLEIAQLLELDFFSPQHDHEQGFASPMAHDSSLLAPGFPGRR
jgi:diguanylate cyclase (GGDEF)-like protein